MNGWITRLKGLFGSKSGRSATIGAVAQPAPAKPVPVPPTGLGLGLGSSKIGATALDGTATSIDLTGKEIISGDQYKIVVPAGSPICLVCSNPTYDRLRHEGNLMLPEALKDNEGRVRRALRALTLAERAECPSCRGVFCWSCLVANPKSWPMDGWNCPRCNAPLPKHPAHSADSVDVLTSPEKTIATDAVVRARRKSPASVLENVLAELSARTYEPGALYFVMHYAELVQTRFEQGKFRDADFPVEREESDAEERERLQKLLEGVEKMFGGMLWGPEIREKLVRPQLETIAASRFPELAARAAALLNHPRFNDDDYMKPFGEL